MPSDGLPMAAVVLVALLTAAMAGCLEPIGSAVQDEIGDDAQASDDAPASRTGEVDASYRTAFAKLDPEGETVDRFAVTMNLTPVSGDDEPLNASFHLDVPDEVAVLSFANGTREARTSNTVFVAAVHGTSFVGTPSRVMATYNGSPSWEDAAKNLSNPTHEEDANLDPTQNLLEPTRLFTDLQTLPEQALGEAQATTYRGQQALAVPVAHGNGTERVDLTVWLDPSTERPLAVEGRLANASSSGGPADIDMAFTYGEDADHRLEHALARQEAMTIRNDTDTTVTLSTNETKTWTIQPSQDPGSVPLDEVEVQLRASSTAPLGGPGTLHVALPAEEGQARTSNATLVYDDVDGDGAVSPGDEIRFTPHTDEASRWTVSLLDEETGMRTVSFAGPLASLLAGALACVGPLRSRP